MVKLARCRAMPHRRVPEPKEPSPFFERLCSELKFKARHRVAEAVDAVCAAFEDELTQLTKPPVLTDYSYELFYDCCSRLTRFIDSNLTTTPGFTVEMDRLIFACHSGDSGTTVRKAMTMDLEIRRGQESEAEEATVEEVSAQPVASPSGTGAAKKKKEVAAGSDNENGVKNGGDATDGDDEDDTSSNKSATVGDTSRKWRTRKRLSTRSKSSAKQGKAKRLKSWVEREEDECEKKEEKRGDESKSSGCVQVERKEQEDAGEQDAGDEHARNQDKEELDGRKRQADPAKQDSGDEPARNQGRDEGDVRKEEARKRTARVISRQKTAAKATSKRKKQVHRLESDAGDATGNDLNVSGGDDNETTASPDKHIVGEAIGRIKAHGTVSGTRKRWRLRSASMLATESCGYKQPGEDGDVGQQTRQDAQAPVAKEVAVSEKSAAPGSTLDTGMGDEDALDAESGAAPQAEQEGTVDNDHQALSSLIHTDLATKSSGLNGVDGDEDDTTSNGSETEVTQKRDNSINVRKDSKLPIVNDFEAVQTEVETANNGSETEVTQNHGNSDNLRKEGKLPTVDDCKAVQTKEPESLNMGIIEVDMGHAAVVALMGHETEPIAEPETDQGRESNTITDEGSAVANNDPDRPASPEDQEAAHAEVIDPSDESPVPGFCDAGMRPESEVSHFQDCLRKSIQFVDAVLCKPPPGKSCSRGCKSIRERQCILGEPCHDDLCSNWHNAEAHTTRCTNPLCEFRDRISLREIMHRIANLDADSQALQAQWKKKTLELIVARGAKFTQLNEDMKQLQRSIDEAKEEMKSLENKKRVLQANLSAIGIMPDQADCFPDFESHYI